MDSKLKQVSPNLHCLKCKTKTKTQKLHLAKSKNGRNMLRGVCDVCGTNKCQFC